MGYRTLPGNFRGTKFSGLVILKFYANRFSRMAIKTRVVTCTHLEVTGKINYKLCMYELATCVYTHAYIGMQCYLDSYRCYIAMCRELANLASIASYNLEYI